jgi:glycosyltransferase involved in cell wall biosynthesis
MSLNLARHLQPLVPVFAVISTYLENRDDWQTAGLPLLEVPTYRSLPQAVLSWLNQPRLLSLARRIRQRSPDVILFPVFHSWSPFLQFYLRKVPAVVVVHDPSPHPGDLDWILENISLQQAARCILLSESLKPALLQRGIPSQRIDVIPLGPLADPAPRAGPARTSNPPVILFFGRLTPYKGLEVLLQAYRQMVATHPARLLIAGEGSLEPYQTQLQGLPEVEIINRWIPEQEIGAIFARADLLALPYTSATQSGVLTIAAAHQLPVVATRTGGLSEQIRAGETGLLVAPGSVEQLRQALQQLLDHPQQAAVMGEALAQEFAVNRNWGKIASLFLESCRKAAHGTAHD